jgi:hypothetical protein
MVPAGLARWQAVLCAGLFCIGCGSICEKAQEKLDGECSDEIARAHEPGQPYALPLGGGEECNEREHCVATCIDEADCPTIAFVMATGGAQRDPDSPPPTGTSSFLSCIYECVPELGPGG